MERGYVKLWRRTLDSGILQSPTSWQVFGWILLNATRSKRKLIVGGQVFQLEPGDYVSSVASLSEALRLSTKQIRTALSLLEKLEILAIKGTNKGSVFSLVNWERYQDEGQAEGQAEGKQRANSGQAKGKPLKEQEREKERILINTPLTPQGELVQGKPARVKAEYPADFEGFWKLYPRKNGKDAALRAWKTKKREGRLPALSVLADAIEAAKRTDQWQRDGGQYIPHPATWLNQGRWMDESAEDSAERERMEEMRRRAQERRAREEAEEKKWEAMGAF